MSGLAGQRVLVTRPRHQVADFVAALERAGAVPVVLPLIAIAPPDDPAPAEAALDRLATYDWIVCTSANGATALGARWAARARPFPVGLRVAALGPHTAAAARLAGLPLEAQATVFRGAALATLGNLAGARILLPRSDLANAEAPDALRDAGAQVDAVTFYRTVPASPDPAALAELRRGVDVLTFASPSAVSAYLALLGDEGRAIAGHATVAVIGPVTAAAARAAGLPVHVQPAVYTAEALVRALDTAAAR